MKDSKRNRRIGRNISFVSVRTCTVSDLRLNRPLVHNKGLSIRVLAFEARTVGSGLQSSLTMTGR